jgi:ABC-type dipeptide/oligopeptide/nickel transport system permease subunit
MATGTVEPTIRLLPVEAVSGRPTSLWRTAMRRLFQRRSALVGMIMLGGLVLTAIFAPWIAPYEPTQVLIGREPVKIREAPCIHLLGCPADHPQHLMGIDGNVRDLFSRVVYGSRVSLVIGIAAVSLAVITGTLLGAFAGWLGGGADNGIMRVMDVLLAFPALLLAIAIVAVLGPGLLNALIAISIVSIPIYARVMRASVLSTREMDYVSASRALGAGTFTILLRVVLPNAMTPLIVVGTLGIATAILEIASLSFLGLAAGEPTPEWGFMVGLERNQLFSAPHLIFFPGLAIMITVLAFNLLGDGLRDALDPRLGRTGTKLGEG